MKPPVLEAADKNSATWQKLVRHYEARLATLRKQNDKDMSAEQTARLRGRIAEIKELLNLTSDKPVHEPDPFVE